MGSDVRGWLRDARAATEQGLLYGVLFGLYYAFVGVWLTVTTRARVGTPVFEREWDLLVVLDACRVDALAAVADEYEFLADRGSIRSVGSTSSEWVTHTFDRRYAAEIAQTAYVTANPHSTPVLRERRTPPYHTDVPFTRPAWDPVDASALLALDEVWRDGRDERLGVVPPATTTDRAIAVGRDHDPGRLLVHYMQPHAPYLAAAVGAEGPLDPNLAAPFDALRAGRLSRDDAWVAYLDTLRLALDEVERLLDNVDAERAVITADHGETFGELGFYEHPLGCPHPAVRRVPWVETTAVDRRTSAPGAAERTARDDGPDADVESQLEDLGYL